MLLHSKSRVPQNVVDTKNQLPYLSASASGVCFENMAAILKCPDRCTHFCVGYTKVLRQLAYLSGVGLSWVELGCHN